jgi:hypothetical protein
MEDIDWPEYIEELWDNNEDIPRCSGSFDWYFIEDLENFDESNYSGTCKRSRFRLSSGKYIDEDIDPL